MRLLGCCHVDTQHAKQRKVMRQLAVDERLQQIDRERFVVGLASTHTLQTAGQKPER